MNDPAIISDITLERFRLHELPAAEAAQVEHQLARDADLQGRLTALERSDDSIRREWPSGELARAIADRLTRQPAKTVSPALIVLRWAVPVAAVALLAFFVVRPTALTPRGLTTAVGVHDGDDRIKGLGATLAIYRRTDGGSELLTDGARAHAGDLLRIGYRVVDPGYGVILSLDGRGLVTVHLPAEGGRAVPLAGGDTVMLDSAYELDDAPKWERFYFVTSTTPFEVEPVLSALRAAATTGDSLTPIAFAPDLEHITFALHKDTRP